MSKDIHITELEKDLLIDNKVKTKITRKKNIIIEDEPIQKIVNSVIKTTEKPVIKTAEKTVIKTTTNKPVKLVKELKINDLNIQKPFLKWVGGKTQIINNIINEMPIEMNNYYEIFLGGGSVLFAILSLQQDAHIEIKNKVYAYDFNKPLIYLYKNIQTKPINFIKTITKIIDEFNAIDGDVINRKPSNIDEALTSQESYYYWIRKQYNSLDLDGQCGLLGSAYFLFLNKTCFRGVFRTGPNGFNVPFGHYKNPGIIDESTIKTISKLIKNVEFNHASFEESLLNVKKDDYVYMDPPYVPVTATSFVGYTSDGFDLKLHEKLFKMCHKMKDDNINFTMSNSNAKLVVDEFDKDKYKIEFIECRRAINSKKPESKINEIIIKSF
jgi:DNA adenine methylase